MKKLTWCAVAQSPYNDFLLSVLNQSFDLEVYYREKEMKTHPWKIKSVDYRLNYMTGNFFRAMKRVMSSDIVWVSGWSYWQHILIMLLPMRSAKKVYWTDTVDVSEEKWSGLKGFFRKQLVKLVFRNFDQVWSTGNPGCEALEKLGCKREKIRSFPFFHDLTRYLNINSEKSQQALAFRNRYSNENDGVIFLVMGQVASKKRFQDSIHALSKLEDKRAILWIAGSGPQEEELKSLCSKLNVLERVKFMGWIQPDDVELAFISADVFVHPSEIDPFPTVVLDAMTWGKPIIGTRQAGSVVDRITPGKNGFIYPAGDLNLLTKHMNYFTENSSEIIKFGLEARKTACDYPVSMAVDRFQSLLVG
ncbi:MAG: glycosyltransferase [Chryseolinea sp.]